MRVRVRVHVNVRVRVKSTNMHVYNVVCMGVGASPHLEVTSTCGGSGARGGVVLVWFVLHTASLACPPLRFCTAVGTVHLLH